MPAPQPNSLPSYQKIAAFFVPLSLTSLMIALSHSVVNAGVARTAQPEVALAAYALARSVVRIIENPMFMVRQTIVSLGRGSNSFNQIKKYMYSLAGAITLILAILGFTPAGYFVLRNVVGASVEVASQGHLALSVLFLLPITSVIRNIYHGAAILARRTIIVPISTSLRLAVMAILVFALAIYTQLPGAFVASLSFVGAFFVEALVMRWRAKPLVADQSHFPAEEGDEGLNRQRISAFFLPLVFTAFIANVFEPVINVGLARSIQPEIALAAFSVGHALSRLFIVPLGMLHQTTLAFTIDGVPATYRITRNFIMFFAVLTTAVMGAVSYTPMGLWILERMIGVSAELSQPARQVMQVMTLMPALFGWREFLWGILMKRRQTGIIGKGKTINLAALLGLLATLILAVPEMHPAAAGAWAMVFGEFAECVYMQYYFGANEQKLARSVQAGKNL